MPNSEISQLATFFAEDLDRLVKSSLEKIDPEEFRTKLLSGFSKIMQPASIDKICTRRPNWKLLEDQEKEKYRRDFYDSLKKSLEEGEFSGMAAHFKLGCDSHPVVDLSEDEKNALMIFFLIFDKRREIDKVASLIGVVEDRLDIGKDRRPNCLPHRPTYRFVNEFHDLMQKTLANLEKSGEQK